jgi:endoglucanase
VIRCVQAELSSHGVPHFQDPVGNIVIGASSPKDYSRLLKKSDEPLRVFIAHMDHPGFHGLRWKSEYELEIQWYGGSPTQHLDGAKVWLADKNQSLGEGTLTEAKLISSGKAIQSGIIRVSAPVRSGSKPVPAEKIFGGFGFRAPVWQENGLIYTKAADDLIGAYSMVRLAIEHFKKLRRTSNTTFLGLLTRAEEVGFIGAIGHFELGWLQTAKRKILCVSLETSRTLPGAEIGKGPVVRLGDRFTVFDAASLRVFTELAQKTLPERHQRRVMDGGTCEATAAMVYGFPSIGISVPLGNYHNQCFEGGPDSRGALGPAPEFVHRDDLLGLLDLCRALMTPRQPWSEAWHLKKKEFKRELKKSKSLLKTLG